jgi:hypothetical protein
MLSASHNFANLPFVMLKSFLFPFHGHSLDLYNRDGLDPEIVDLNLRDGYLEMSFIYL